MQGALLVIVLFGLVIGGAEAQVSVVPPTGIAPKFPNADPELAKQAKPPSRNWLRDANDDTERSRRIELWAGAGDLEMQDIAHRMKETQRAIQRENWDMAIYQWEKIRGRMIVAMIKRPTRTQNMEAMFLENGIYQGLHQALKARDVARAREGFVKARAACMACHAAEKIPFINDSAVFTRIGSFASAGD